MKAILLALGTGTLLTTAATIPDRSPRKEVFEGIPIEVERLAKSVSDPTGFGPKVCSLLRDRGKADALKALADQLPGWLTQKNHGDLIQSSSGGYYYSITILQASLQEIENGEEEQGKVMSDSGWDDHGNRSLTIKAEGTKVHLRQFRSQRFQRSQYYWDSWGYHGQGIDWLAPIAGASGATEAYLLCSVYKDDYHKDIAKEQRKAVRLWTKNSE